MLYFHGQCEITVKKQAILIYLEFIPDSTGEYATAGFLTEGKKKKKIYNDHGTNHEILVYNIIHETIASVK